MPESLRLVPEALRFFAASPKAWFKFVVATPADLAEIQDARPLRDPAERILLMPEGRTASRARPHRAVACGICRDLGFRFCDRLHIRLWGDRRGV